MLPVVGKVGVLEWNSPRAAAEERICECVNMRLGWGGKIPHPADVRIWETIPQRKLQFSSNSD